MTKSNSNSNKEEPTEYSSHFTSQTKTLNAIDQPFTPSSLQPNQSMNIIYPLVQTEVKGFQINVVLDEFAGLSYATEKTVSNLKLAVQDLPEKVVVEGFGGALSDPID